MQFDIQRDIAFLHAAGVLKWLLEDRTTRKHILWGTDAYRERGPEYARDQEIEIGQITGENSSLLKTRAQKAAEQQTERTRQHAEVFTPAWICQMMNDQADREWFGQENVFFLPDGTPTERVDFKRKSWKRYVDSKRLEITCGEAPYLASRYDVSSGEPIPLARRVGMLDRKLRVVNENTDTEADWLKWAFRAFEATYGYEFQGGNLLIARVNLMMTFAEALDARWHREPTGKEWQRLSRIVTWNIWQMDGLTYTLPYAKGHELIEQTDFLLQFGFPPIQDERQPACRVYLWRYLKASTAFLKLKEGADGMKFDFIIRNPPYQEERQGDSNTATPIYHLFMDSAYSISDRVLLISPARFLFNSGYTSKAWNQERLNDTHFKVEAFYPSSFDVFHGVDIKGGIAITYRDTGKNFGPIEVFTVYPELNHIFHRITSHDEFHSIVDIIVTSFAYHFTAQLYQENPSLIGRASKGHEYDLQSNIFDTLSEVFFDHVDQSKDEYIRILGRSGNQRIWKWIKRSYVKHVANLDKYKLFLPKAAGIGQFGETLPETILGRPGDGATITFSSIGYFGSEEEANRCNIYLKTKFARALLGVLKVTQDLTPGKFKYVPLQNFSSSSDIDWSVSIPEIDRQLYAKYGLDENEIAFIESHVKEMV